MSFIQTGSGKLHYVLEVLKSDPRMPKEFSSMHLESLFDPARYLGEAPAFVERVLVHHRHRKA